MNVECSVVVCTYRPEWQKLKRTLKSILMQENCDYKIVITDDGSEENYFINIKNYMAEFGFQNYELISNMQNYGTVKNIRQGMSVCEGEFVKIISPGDFLHGKYVLRNWIDFMHEHCDCIMSFCDMIYYHMEKNTILATKEYAHPQWATNFDEGCPLIKYIIYGDTCSGAATMLRRDAWVRYLDMIVDKVIYTEDVAYRVMLYCGEKIAHIPRSFLLYEYGTGISTCGSDIWVKRISHDFKVSDDIMLSLDACDEAKHLRISDYLKIPKDKTWQSRLRRLKIAPFLLYYRIKTKLFPFTTPVDMDEKFITELLT